MTIDHLIAKNLVPDTLIRQGIRRLLRQRLKDETQSSEEGQQAHFMDLLKSLRTGPIAVQTQAANTQHYEVPTAFYQAVLGPHLKYSSGYWKPGVTSLEQSEADMLALTCERADLKDGQDILELGCGWGSLSLFMAQRYPKSRITGVSNSGTQREYIESRIEALHLNNLKIITADMNTFDAGAVHDRVVSVEMFEHMRNHERLLKNVAQWLKPGGKLFVHIFTHKTLTYLFEAKDDSDWMSRYFFTGGMMPGDPYLLYFQNDLKIEEHWRVEGTHYQKTSEAWLQNMDAQRSVLWPLFEKTYGADQAMKWWAYWRIFFMSCAELWGFRKGTEWFVSHYRFTRP
jgi:cyclopropane-fatty-acyl-phospholipid synthase